MVSRLLSRATGSTPRSLSLTLARVLRSSSYPDPIPSAAAAAAGLHSLVRPLDHGALPPSDPRSPPPRPSYIPDLSAHNARAPLGPQKIWGYDCISTSRPYKLSQANLRTIPRWFSVRAQGGATEHQTDEICSDTSTEKKNNIGARPDNTRVMLFSPLEATAQARASGLGSESLKIKRMELSQKATYALIPALLLISKTKLTTSVIVLSVFWQIYGFFKEIFLDYVHQEVTRRWVLIYFKLLLLIVAKDLVLNFDLV